MALEKLTPLSPEEGRELRLLFDGDNPADQRPALDALLKKVGTLSPQAGAELRLGTLSPDAPVRWMLIQILASAGDPPLAVAGPAPA